MPAILTERFGGPYELVLRGASRPDPADGTGAVDLRASLDWHEVLVRRGLDGSRLPHVFGWDGAGVRCDVGDEVVVLPSRFWGDEQRARAPDPQVLGDRVNGTSAERVCVHAEYVVREPADLDWTQPGALPFARRDVRP